MTEEEILKKLLIEEKDTIKDLADLVDQASKIFKIEKPSGKIVFQNFGILSDSQRILSLLIGKYFGNKIGLVTDNSLSISQIADELGRPKTALSGPVKELIKKGFVEKSPTKRYSVAYHRIKEMFDKTLKM